MSVTTDRDDPRLTHGIDETPRPQAEVYIVLSEEERAKGFVRPYRDKYRHVGAHGLKMCAKPSPHHPDGVDKDGQRWLCCLVEHDGPCKAWAHEDEVMKRMQPTKGCGGVTSMGSALSETYARNPKFYGATYCVHCQMHRPVNEFVWDVDGEVVGS